MHKLKGYNSLKDTKKLLWKNRKENSVPPKYEDFHKQDTTSECIDVSINKVVM